MRKVKLSKPLVIDERIEGDLVRAIVKMSSVLSDSSKDALEGGAGTKEWREMVSKNFSERATLLSQLADELEEADWEDV